MQFMADFLLESSSKKPAAKTQTSLLTASNKQGATSAPRFSNVYAQQQQARELAAQSAAAKPAPQVRQEQPKNTQDAGAKPPSAPAHKKAAADSSSKTKTTESQAKERPEEGAKQHKGQEVDSQGGKELPAEAGAEAGDSSLAAQMDPLLWQIMQAQQGGADTEVSEQVAELLGEEQAEPVVLGTMTAFSSMTAEQRGQKTTHMPSASLAQGVGDELKAKAEGEGEELLELDELELSVDEEPVSLRQVLTQTASAQNSSEARQSSQAQLMNDVKPGTEASVRTDTLLRAESVQQTATARQVPGSPVAMQQPGWSKEVTDKVMWMSSKNLKSAEIKLDPAELGRLEVRVQVVNEQTQITFASPHAGVRESLESQSFRLREMMEQQGMQDVDVNVSDQSESEQQERELHELMAQQHRSGSTQSEDEEDVKHRVTEVPMMETGHSGRVSYYV